MTCRCQMHLPPHALGAPGCLYPLIDIDRLVRALLPGHLFEHPGNTEDCPRVDAGAARAMAEDIASEYARLSAGGATKP